MLKLKSLLASISVGAGLVVAAALPVAAGDSNGNFQVKLGVTGGLLQDNTKSLEVRSPAGIVIDDVKARGGYGKTDDVVIPSLTLTYYLTKNWAVELFCCAASTSVNAGGAVAGLGELAHTAVFPPVLTLQYHFDQFGAIKPYVGVGFEYIHYFNEKLGSNGLNGYAPGAVVFTDVKFKDSWGFALQGGVDYDLGGGWSLGLDVKKVWLDTTITWTAAQGHTVVAKHDLDPLYITANLGYRFNLDDLFGRRAEPAPLK